MRPGPIPREQGLLASTSTSRWVRTAERRDLTGIPGCVRTSVTSQNRAEAAIKAGFFEREILPVTLADGTVVSTDDGPAPA